MKLNLEYILITGAVLTTSLLYAQEEAPQDDLYTLSLEELMNVPINSASKKNETLFDAPLSSYTITRSDIDKAGSTSVMEALRLSPGVIVREQSNGVYDIHIRGFDNALRYTQQPFTKSDFTTLVMIDNRPVFNNNLGGTFWESLPIDINDVERIEIVRGPSAPLFGPNAVTGVINIITRRPTQQGLYTNATVQYGTPDTRIANASIGSKINEKFNFVVSGNYQERERFDDTYYYIPTQQFVNPVAIFTGSTADPQTAAAKRYPDPSQALKKWGANGFVVYKPTEHIALDLSIGLQKDEVQKVFLGVAGPGTSQLTYFTNTRSDSRYANLSASFYGFKVRTSFVDGYDNINLEGNPSQYDFINFDANIEYEVKITEKNTITPGVSYQSVEYTDRPYATETNPNNGFLNNERSINTLAGFVRTDLNPSEHWRIMAAVRADRFSTPDVTRVAYELATTYKFNTNNLIRAAVTQSNSGSFIGNNYLDVTVATGIPTAPYAKQSGNQDLDLLTIRMYEIGYRAKLAKGLQLDIDVFRQELENLSAIQLASVTPTQLPPPVPPFIPQYQFQNVPTTLQQVGTTISINYVPNEKIQFKPFVTIQKTETKDLVSEYTNPAVNPTVQFTDSKHRNTPSWYGGFFLNFKPASKFNINVSSYTYASHNQYDYADKTGTSAMGKIEGKFLLNLRVQYNVTNQFSVFVNGRNILNNDAREYFATDQIGGVYLGGLSFNFN